MDHDLIVEHLIERCTCVIENILQAPDLHPGTATLGAGLARRYMGILGTAEALAARITQAIRAAGWERIPIGEILGDGAP